MSGDKEKGTDYGHSWGPFFWHYYLTAGLSFSWKRGWTFRWYGLSIPFTPLAFGLMVRRKEAQSETTD